MKNQILTFITLTMLFVGMIPKARADVISNDNSNQSFIDQAMSFCTSKGGVSTLLETTSPTGKTCKIAICSKDSQGNTVDASKCQGNDGAADYAYVCVKKTICISDSQFLNAGQQGGGNNSGQTGGAAASSQGGANAGQQSGANGGQSGGAFNIEGSYITVGHACYSKCRKHWLTKKQGADRKACRRCLGLHTGDDQVYVQGYATTGVNVQGTTTGVTTGVIQGGGDDDGISVDVNASVLARLPAGCVKNNGKIKRKCLIYLTGGGAATGSGNCSYYQRLNQCLTDSEYAAIVAAHGVGSDCVNCGGRGSGAGSVLSGIAEIFGAIAPPLAGFGASYFSSKFAADSSKAWANACSSQYTTYVGYMTTNEMPGITPEQQKDLQCNGSGYNQFAGMNGNMGMNGMFGNPWMSGGYSPGFLAGMMGPYGQTGFPGTGGGMFAGGFNGGIVQGVVNGGMMAAGYPGGMMAAGYPGGWSGGAIQGVVNGGMMTAQAQGGWQGGWNNGGWANGGVQGWNGGQSGWQSGGWANGGASGWANGGGWNGGGGQCACFAPPCTQCGGGWNGGGNPWGSGTGQWGGQGNYWGASGGWGGQQDYMNNMQASSMDAYYQQQGLANQFGIAGQNYQNGAYGSAGFSPWNTGGSLSMNYGMPGYYR